MTVLSLAGSTRLLPRAALFLAAAVAIALGSALVQQARRPTIIPAPPDQAAGSAADSLAAPDAPSKEMSSLASLDRTIAVWAANVDREPRDFISNTNLGLLYGARGRLTGDVADHDRARSSLERALAAEPTYRPARLLHAGALFSLHDFGEALSAAQALLVEDPGLHQARAIVGDARLETGDVRGAQAAYSRLAREVPGAPVTARLARVSFLQGRPAESAALAERALREARAAGERGASLGWYELQAGTLALQAGDRSAARRHLVAADQAWPDAPAVLLAQARLALIDGRPSEARELLSRAVAIAPQPESLALLGDLYSTSGDPVLAEEHYAAVDLIGRLAGAQKRTYDRQLVLFQADHGRDVAAAVRQAEADLVVRQDIYGYDAYAWALHAAGRSSDAREPMRRALALGTKDARLFYHAGMIELAAGSEAEGVAYLDAALALDAGSEVLGPVRARAALACVRSASPGSRCGSLGLGGDDGQP
jgi:tetratricopeptide (TPR) repeat protein